MRKLAQCFDWVVGFMAVVAAILVFFDTLSVTAEVILRSGFGKSLGWVEEVTAYSLLYICFLVAPWVLAQDGHVNVDLVVSRLGPRAKLWVSTVACCLAALICLVLTWYGTQLTLQLYQTKYFNPTVLAPPKFIFVAVVPLGFVLMFIQFIRKISRGIALLRGREFGAEEAVSTAAMVPERFGI